MKSSQKADLPTLSTERLILRPLTLWDAEDMFEYAHQELTTKYLLWHPHTNISQTIEHIAHIKKNYTFGNSYDFAIELKESGKMIGTCGFVYIDEANKNAEVGYVLHPSYWNQGFATEALNTVIKYGFDKLALSRIEARFIAENTASAAVMKKCGMTFEGISKKSLKVKGKLRDIGVYSILKDNLK